MGGCAVAAVTERWVPLGFRSGLQDGTPARSCSRHGTKQGTKANDCVKNHRDSDLSTGYAQDRIGSVFHVEHALPVAGIGREARE